LKKDTKGEKLEYLHNETPQVNALYYVSAGLNAQIAWGLRLTWLSLSGEFIKSVNTFVSNSSNWHKQEFLKKFETYSNNFKLVKMIH